MLSSLFRNVAVAASVVRTTVFSNALTESIRTKTTSLHGRLFYKRRPKEVPYHLPLNYKKRHLEGAPQKKGICFVVRTENPGKPNSGNRAVARVRLSSGKKIKVYIPGVGHNLNVHSVVLVKGGLTHDLHGTYFKAIRGVHDLQPVKNRGSARSLYGVKLSAAKKAWRKTAVRNKKFLAGHDDFELYNTQKWMHLKDEEGKPILGKPLEYGKDVLPMPKMFNLTYRINTHWK